MRITTNCRTIARWVVVLVAVPIVLGGCGGGNESASSDSGRSAPAFAVGGTIAGLDEGHLELANGLDRLRIDADPNGLALDRPFAFNSPLPAGAGYNITIQNDPLQEVALQCDVVRGRGTMGNADVSDILVRCARVKSLRLLAGKVIEAAPGRDGLAADARFNRPASVTVDAQGNLYVADTENETLRRITPSGVVSTLAGSAGQSGSADGTGPEAQFSIPLGTAVDGAGNVYVADFGNSTVRKVTPQGVVSTLAGLAGSPGAADGAGAAARFRLPRAVAVDAQGTVYVADTRNHTVRRITPDGVVSTLAGSAGQTGSTDGRGSAARFIRPSALALDATGNLYVKNSTFVDDDSGATLRRITPQGDVTTVVTGLSGTLEAGLALDDQGQFILPVSAALRRVATDGTVSVLAGLVGDPGAVDGPAAAARFGGLGGVAVEADGAIVMADTVNGTVRRLRNGLVSTVAGSAGSSGYLEGTGAAARFDLPRGIVVDADGNLVVADFWNHVVRRITPDGVTSLLAGSPGNSGQANGPAADARFTNPDLIAIDGNGTVYVVDASIHRIRRIEPDGIVSDYAGADTPGTADGPLATARFNQISALAVDRNDNLYVAERGSFTLRRITQGGQVSTVAGSAGLPGFADGLGALARFTLPISLTTDRNGNVFVVDASTAIRRVTPAGEVSTIAGVGGASGTVNGIGSAARFNGADGLVADAAGNLYVAEPGTVRLVRPQAGGGYAVQDFIGTAGDSTLRLGALPTSVGFPRRLAVTARRLYMTNRDAVVFIDR